MSKIFSFLHKVARLTPSASAACALFQPCSWSAAKMWVLPSSGPRPAGVWPPGVGVRDGVCAPGWLSPARWKSSPAVLAAGGARLGRCRAR